ncbi:retrovirus-related Pol polyprotein from transposon 412 [Trichonephila clavipes]|nr:retrovirus-related Pol polyprotein from transposon 412 [Trichonephila clavipes]
MENMQRSHEEIKERMENMQRSHEEIKERMENMQRNQEDTRKGQQEMQKGLEDMQKSQEETKNELKDRMEKGLENVQKCQEDLKNSLEKKIDSVEEKISSVEDRIAEKMEEIAVVEEKMEKKMEEKIERFREQFEEVAGNLSQQIEDFENKFLACGNTMNKSKFVPASPVPVPASPVSVKLPTYDRKTNWEVYKIQFSLISEATGLIEGVKACQLAASLRGETAEILQTVPNTKCRRKCTRGRLQLYNVGVPFDRIAFDILGLLPRTSDGNNILVVLDYFTKGPEAYPISDEEASTVAEVLVERWISRYRVPLYLHSDQGRNFDSAVCKRLWSAVHETTVYFPSQMLFACDFCLRTNLLLSWPSDTPLSSEEFVEKLQVLDGGDASSGQG